jgi:hypothetical protein
MSLKFVKPAGYVASTVSGGCIRSWHKSFILEDDKRLTIKREAPFFLGMIKKVDLENCRALCLLYKKQARTSSHCLMKEVRHKTCPLATLKEVRQEM